MVLAMAATAEAFASACNFVLGVATQTGRRNKFDLQRLAYKDVRSQFGLSANLAIRAVSRVAAAMATAKANSAPLPEAFRPTSVDYDARIFEYRADESCASLTTMAGRIRVPLRLGPYQRDALAGKKPTAAVLCRKGKLWTINIVIEDVDAPLIGGDGVVGVDLGIRNTAATSKGTLHNGHDRQVYKEKKARVRASLQSKGTQGARRVLRRLSGRERRYIRHENHVISKKIVAESVKAHCGTIRMEQLTGIRFKTRTWNKHLNRMRSGWSFGELQMFVGYKATRSGVAVELVNPAYTSRICSGCKTRGDRTGDRFRCTTCGDQHADTNAAVNIAGGGVVSHPRIRKPRKAKVVHGLPKSSGL